MSEEVLFVYCYNNRMNYRLVLTNQCYAIQKLKHDPQKYVDQVHRQFRWFSFRKFNSFDEALEEWHDFFRFDKTISAIGTFNQIINVIGV